MGKPTGEALVAPPGAKSDWEVSRVIGLAYAGPGERDGRAPRPDMLRGSFAQAAQRARTIQTRTTGHGAGTPGLAPLGGEGQKVKRQVSVVE